MPVMPVINAQQREGIFLLSVGTFLEYFDLMLYVHMAVFLNDIFFPKTDPHTTTLLIATTFCSAFVFRPIGALIFGYVGDNYGRRSAITIATFLVAISCVTIATLPTYDQIGITSAVILTICRLVQGISSMGEAVGAEIYLTETLRPPAQYPAVASVSIFAGLGGFAALGIAYLTISYGFNWRNVFWIGAVIAVAGSLIRIRLKETAEFLSIKSDATYNALNNILNSYDLRKRSQARYAGLALFLIQCAYPVCFYFAYIYCGDILKTSFDYNITQVILQNLMVALVQVCGFSLLAYLSYKIYPLKIVKIRLVIFSVFIFLYPYLLYNASTPLDIFMIQVCIVLFWAGDGPAMPIFLSYIPINKRFTYAGFAFALSRALVYVITSFGFIYLTKSFGYYGLTIIMIPVSVAFMLGISYFNKLEEAK